MESLSQKQLDQLLPIMASLFTLASASKSKRRSCACAFVKWRHGIPTIVSSGVNGTPVGTSNECEPQDLSMTYRHVVHAEINAMASAQMPLFKSNVLVCTDSPCPDCLAAIKEKTQIQHVVFARRYRVDNHLTGLNFYELDMDLVVAQMQEGIDRITCVISTGGH